MGNRIIFILMAILVVTTFSGCRKYTILKVYGDNPFQPHFSVESSGKSSNKMIRISSFSVSQLLDIKEGQYKTVWHFDCFSGSGVKTKEIVYGILPEGCKERVKMLPLEGGVVYWASGSFNKGDLSGNANFMIFEASDNTSRLKYSYKLPEEWLKTE